MEWPERWLPVFVLIIVFAAIRVDNTTTPGRIKFQLQLSSVIICKNKRCNEVIYELHLPVHCQRATGKLNHSFIPGA